MATTLRNTITNLATAFASSILDAIRETSLDDILAETRAGGARGASRVVATAARASGQGGRGAGPRKSGRLARRSGKDIAAVVDQIVAVLKKNKAGMRAEQIRDALGLASKEMPRPLAEGLAKKRISKKGQKRATTYSAR